MKTKPTILRTICAIVGLALVGFVAAAALRRCCPALMNKAMRPRSLGCCDCGCGWVAGSFGTDCCSGPEAKSAAESETSA